MVVQIRPGLRLQLEEAYLVEEACRSNPRSTVENSNSTQRDENRIVISDSRVSPVAERIRVLNDIWRSLLLVVRFDEHTQTTTRIPETCHEITRESTL